MQQARLSISTNEQHRLRPTCIQAPPARVNQSSVRRLLLAYLAMSQQRY